MTPGGGGSTPGGMTPSEYLLQNNNESKSVLASPKNVQSIF